MSAYVDLKRLIEKLEFEDYELKLAGRANASHPAASQIRELTGYLDEGDTDVVSGLLEFLFHEAADVREIALIGLLRNYPKLEAGAKKKIRYFSETPNGHAIIFRLMNHRSLGLIVH